MRRAAAVQWSAAYTGTQFMAVWAPAARSAMVEVSNIPGHGTVVRAAGAGETFLARTGHGTHPVGLGTGADADAGPGDVDRMTHSFTLRLAGHASSAGRPATLVEARRADRSLAARFWLDEASGLLLRRELYDPAGALVRASGFAHLETGPRAVSALPRPLATARAEAVAPASYPLVATEGWHCCPAHLGAGLDLYAVRRIEAESTLHLSYTDGLTTASVFEQQGRLDVAALEGFAAKETRYGKIYVRYGLSSYAVWARNGLVYTAVCDTPHGLNAVVGAFSDSRTGPESAGIAQRLDRGMARMVSWLNPFD